MQLNADAENNIRLKCNLSLFLAIYRRCRNVPVGVYVCLCRLKTHETKSEREFFDEEFLQFIFRSIEHCTTCSITVKWIFLETRYFSLKITMAKATATKAMKEIEATARENRQQNNKYIRMNELQLHADGTNTSHISLVSSTRKQTNKKSEKQNRFYYFFFNVPKTGTNVTKRACTINQ